MVNFMLDDTCQKPAYFNIFFIEVKVLIFNIYFLGTRYTCTHMGNTKATFFECNLAVTINKLRVKQCERCSFFFSFHMREVNNSQRKLKPNLRSSKPDAVCFMHGLVHITHKVD